MSLKVKLKRVFLKARKFLIINFVIILLMFSFVVPASAEKRYYTSFLTLTKARATDYADSNFTSYYDLYPKNFDSVYGGNSQMFILPENSSTTITTYRGINANMYFDQITFKKDLQYTISFYIVIPKILLDPYSSNNEVNDLVGLDCSLYDINRKKRIDFVINKTEYVSSLYGSKELFQINKYWDWNTLDNASNADTFGFYFCSQTFIPSEDFKGYFFNFYFDLYNEFESTKLFGLSDLILSYEIDPLTDPNYSSINSGSVTNHNKLENEIMSDTEAGRETAVGMIEGINDLSDSDLFKGLLAWSNIITHNLSNAPWFSQLLKFSLSIGLFAFLLGLGIYVANVHSSKARRENSKSNRKGRGG